MDEAKIELSNDFRADYYKFSSVNIVLALGGSDGGRSWSNDDKFIGKLKELNYSLLSLAYFGESGLPDELSRIPIEYFEKAIEWIKNSNYKNIVVLGVSKGGELALLLASMFREINAVIGLVPGSVVFQGISRKMFPRHSSWEYQGKDLPFVPFSFRISDFRDVYKKQEYVNMYRRALTKNDKAAIKVENINGPVLVLSGKRDKVWPSSEMCESIIKRLQDNKFGHQCGHFAFDTGHNVFDDKLAWDPIIRFLKKVRT